MLSQGSRDVGTVCAQGRRAHEWPRRCVLYPGALGVLIPSPERDVFGSAMTPFGQSSRDSCATPWPGAPESPHQVEDGTLQHKANTHPPQKNDISPSLCPVIGTRGLSHAL